MNNYEQVWKGMAVELEQVWERSSKLEKEGSRNLEHVWTRVKHAWTSMTVELEKVWASSIKLEKEGSRQLERVWTSMNKYEQVWPYN